MKKERPHVDIELGDEDYFFDEDIGTIFVNRRILKDSIDPDSLHLNDYVNIQYAEQPGFDDIFKYRVFKSDNKGVWFEYVDQIWSA